MDPLIGIRQEDKNRWERRTPLIPEHIKELKSDHAIDIWVQPSKIRTFSDEDYSRAGARVQEDLSLCPVILAIKEIPINFFEPEKTYVFFAHVIKGQPYNMPMLKRMLKLKCTLIDYERVVDEKGRRLIFFGRHAGLAGMIDTLWAFGQRLNWEGISNPFSEVLRALQYQSLTQAKEAISKVGEKIKADGFANSLTPLICGFAGYGNVSQGAQEILDLLPIQEIAPEEISSTAKSLDQSRKLIYKVVFKEEHMVEPISAGDRFELQDYYDHPEKYCPKFETYIPYLTLLMNGIYWDKRYPRLVTKEYLRQLYKGARMKEAKCPRLRVIGDISCDIEGAIECTIKCTEPGNPIFVYDPFEDRATDGFEGVGPVVLAVDNLPCELPREASTNFSQVLKNFIPEIVKADYSVPFDRCKLPSAVKNAVIAYHGELTPNYRYIEKFLS